MKFSYLVVLLSLSITFNSCGTIFLGTKQSVKVETSQPGAEIFVNGEATGKNAPSEISIPKKRKDAPKGDRFTHEITVRKEGFHEASTTIQGRVGSKGALVGYLNYVATLGLGFILDSSNGALREYDSKVRLELYPIGGEERIVYVETGGKEKPVELNADVNKNLPKSNKVNRDAIAVVIGNRDYKHTKDVDYAIHDARATKQYLIEVFGFDEANIIFEENATKGTFETIFGTESNKSGKLSNYVKPGRSDVFVFYSGHGAPGLKDQRGYFVPVEAEPNFLENGGYALDTFYSNIGKIDAKSITVVTDACFSGATVFEGISPLVIKSNPVAVAGEKLTVISSSTGAQVSSWYEEQNHGLFTYYFLKAIHNKNADKNGDNKITYQELYDFISDEYDGVPYMAKRKGIAQNPTIQSKRLDKVFLEW